MPTEIAVGSPLARKVFGVALFAGTQIEPGFMNLLSGPMPQQADAEAKLSGSKVQTSPDYPIVKAMDLTKTQGTLMSVDMFNPLTGKPVMGDKKIQSRLMSLTNSSMDFSINQARAGADAGGRVTQQRTAWNLRSIGMAGLKSHATRYEDQVAFVHLAGQRGSQNNQDWVIPLATDADFTDIMVNTVQPPTKNRHFFAADATALTNLDSTDILTLTDFDRLSALLSDSVLPLQSIKVKGDTYAWNDPLWCAFVTKRQWLYLQTRSGERSWRTFLQNAYERRSAGMRHPLFYGDAGMWAGILIRPINRMAIRFAAGDSVTVSTDDTPAAGPTTAVQTAAVDTDRAIIVGAQALMKGYGIHGDSDYHYSWYEEKSDHGNAVEMSYAMMCGAAKARFYMNSNSGTKEWVDYGVAVLDSYAPDPNSAAGKALLAA